MHDSDNQSALVYGVFKHPEKSDWQVWLMGDAIVYRPNKGQEPNWFHRKMQELCFGFQWRKVK